jgi:galactose-1-phosphate uridylyltransferase
MNERILDICIKAGINTWPFNEVGFISLDESELVKFAELIVRECASFIDSTFDIDGHSGEVISWVAGGKLKEHFGVKE